MSSWQCLRTGFLHGQPDHIAIDEFQRGGNDLLLALKMELDGSNGRGQYLLAGSTRWAATRLSVVGDLGAVASRATLCTVTSDSEADDATRRLEPCWPASPTSSPSWGVWPMDFVERAGNRLLGRGADLVPEGGIFAFLHPDDATVATTTFNEVIAGPHNRRQTVDRRVLETYGNSHVRAASWRAEEQCVPLGYTTYSTPPTPTAP